MEPLTSSRLGLTKNGTIKYLIGEFDIMRAMPKWGCPQCDMIRNYKGLCRECTEYSESGEVLKPVSTVKVNADGSEYIKVDTPKMNPVSLEMMRQQRRAQKKLTKKQRAAAKAQQEEMMAAIKKAQDDHAQHQDECCDDPSCDNKADSGEFLIGESEEE